MDARLVPDGKKRFKLSKKNQVMPKNPPICLKIQSSHFDQKTYFSGTLTQSDDFQNRMIDI